MEVTISIATIFKIMGLIPIGMFVSLFTLWPINDRPASKTRKIVFAVIMLVIATLMFGPLSFNFTR